MRAPEDVVHFDREEAQMSGVYWGLSDVTVCGWPLFLAPDVRSLSLAAANSLTALIQHNHIDFRVDTDPAT